MSCCILCEIYLSADISVKVLLHSCFNNEIGAFDRVDLKIPQLVDLGQTLNNYQTHHNSLG